MLGIFENINKDGFLKNYKLIICHLERRGKS